MKTNERLEEVEPALSVVFCTRNRPQELLTAVKSATQGQAADFPVELLIVDDGLLDEQTLHDIKSQARKAGFAYAYTNKCERAGLLQSRVEALRHARHGIVLFLDDDVELLPGYLERLMSHYRNDPMLAGAGGVDVLEPRAPLFRQLFEYVILFRSFQLGRYSWSGFGGGMDGWRFQPRPFRVDFLYGCNMSFRKSALSELKAAVWFNSYGIGEDMYVSDCASRMGTLLVDPQLQVRHYQAATARDRDEDVARTRIVNHFLLLQARGAGAVRMGGFLWTALGFAVLHGAGAVLKTVVARRSSGWERARGTVKGVATVLRSLLAGPRTIATKSVS